MKLDLLSFLVGLMFIPMVFVLRRRTLTEERFLKPLYIIAFALAAIGLLTIPYVDARPNFYIFLICPLCSLTIHRLLYLWFKTSLHREPQDTFMVWFPKKDLSWDRAFNFVFLFISLSMPLFLLAILVPK
jgi:hypothetical protein